MWVTDKTTLILELNIQEKVSCPDRTPSTTGLSLSALSRSDPTGCCFSQYKKQTSTTNIIRQMPDVFGSVNISTVNTGRALEKPQ